MRLPPLHQHRLPHRVGSTARDGRVHPLRLGIDADRPRAAADRLIQVFGREVWLGWLMIGALVYSGRARGGVSAGQSSACRTSCYDKVLYADAQMNRADWMTVTAAIVEVLGIGAGIWWLDAIAAMVIGLDITRDG